MSEVVSQIIIYLILVALIGGSIGYLIGRASCAKKSSCNEKPQKSTHEVHIDQIESNGKNEAKEFEEKPTLLSAPLEGEKDNLQLIKGVGKVSEKLLNDIGIYHFNQIANLTPKEVIWLNNAMGTFSGKIEREEWVSQSKELAQNSK